MSRFAFDRHRAPADEYRQYYRAAGSARAPQRTGEPPARMPERIPPTPERAVPQADGEP